MNDGWIWGAVLFWQLKTEGLRLKTDRAYTHHQDMKELKEQKGAFGLEGQRIMWHNASENCNKSRSEYRGH